jgi:hypothetical protein
VAIAYLSEQEDEDAARTAELVGQAGRRCVTIRGDLAEEGNCDRAAPGPVWTPLIPANDLAGAGQKGSPWRCGGSGRFLTWSGTEPNSPCSSP